MKRPHWRYRDDVKKRKVEKGNSWYYGHILNNVYVCSKVEERERDSKKQQSIKKAVTSTKINKISFLKFRSIPEIMYKKSLSHYTFIVIHLEASSIHLNTYLS